MAAYEYLIDSGTVIADTGPVRDEVVAEWRSVLGQQLSDNGNTPQGVAINSDTLARVSTAKNNAALANQLNRNIAGGIFLDGLGALMDMPRVEGTPTIIPDVTLNGEPLTVIPAGTQIQDANSPANVAESITEVTLSSTGGAQVNFQLLNDGAIDIPVHTLNIITPGGPLGLETADNTIVATLGTTGQKDPAYRTFQNETLANQGSGIEEACMAAIAQINGFWSQTFRQNVLSIEQEIDGVTMASHSLYSCVSGGTDLAIAQALDEKKGGGCGYNNGPGINGSVPITNPFSGQVIDVLFDRPNLIPIGVAVTVVMVTSVVDPSKVVKQAILDYAAGETGPTSGLKVGTTVSAFELAKAISQEVPELYVKDILIGLVSDPPPVSSDPIPIAIFEMATVITSNITVTVDSS